MFTCHSFVDRQLLFFLLFIFVSLVIIKSHDDETCPLIEISSFGTDFNMKCNETYFQFNEINTGRLKWLFAHRNSFCRKKDKIEAVVNECGVNRTNEKYLKVRLKAFDHNEYACVYCRINYKPVAPMISVTRLDDSPDEGYMFNLTATGLNWNETFEILWAKRAHVNISHSLNYWFLPGCHVRDVRIVPNTGRSIVFTVDDKKVGRVEFIIRRCRGTCLINRRCSESLDPTFNSSYALTSLEKIVCDYNCLNGTISPSSSTTPTMNTLPLLTNDLFSSTIQLSKEKQSIKYLILCSLLACLIALSLIILGCFIHSRIKDLRTDNVYTKTSNINLDEKKETIDE